MKFKKRKKKSDIIVIKLSKETATKLVNGEEKEELLQGIIDYLKEMGIEKENE